MILRLYLEAEIVTRAILATLLLKIFPGEHAPGPLPRWVRFWRTGTHNSFDKGPMLHSDPGPINFLRGPGLRWVALRSLQQISLVVFLHMILRFEAFSADLWLKGMCREPDWLM